MSPQRILVVRLGAMGDILHTLPAVASLRASFPRAEISWAVHPKWRRLLDGGAAADRLIFVNRRDWASLRSAFAALRAGPFDLVIDFQGLIQSAIVARVARAGHRYGFHRDLLRERPAALLYSQTVLSTAAHVVDRNLDLAAAAGATVRLHSCPLPPGVPEGDLPDGPFVLAAPFAGWASKQWPIEHYTQLAAALPVPLVLNVAPFQQEALLDLPNVHLHVSSIAGLIHATRRATAVVGVDSGPLHLAAALGRPGVAIFGPTDPARNGPYGGSLVTLRAPGAPTTYKRGAEIDVSMRSISPDQVLTAIMKVL